MHIHLSKPDARLFIVAHLNDERIKATSMQEIGPGWRYFGRTFEEWSALPAGPYELPPDYNPDDDHPPPGIGEPE
jgi:hypothetical protein